MSRLKVIALFWWDFVVGDDWLTAVGVIGTIVVTKALAATGVGDWWLMPLAVAAPLYLSIKRATRR